MLSPVPVIKSLRLSVSNRCNSNCSICSWDKSNSTSRNKWTRFSPDDYAFIARSAHESGRYQRCMLTGGEPLLLPNKLLKALVSSISRVPFDRFWICTNGTLLKNKAAILSDSGLRNIVVSLAASEEVSYQYYAHNCFTVKSILEGIEAASKANIEVRVDACVFNGENGEGVHDYAGFMKLYGLVKSAGARAIAFFPVNKTAGNIEVFDRIYSSVDEIVDPMQKDSFWNLNTLPNGQLIMTSSDGFKVVLPTVPETYSDKCQIKTCGSYCQGIYAVYIENEVLRFCQRIFSDHSNEINIYQMVKGRDKKRLIESLIKAAEWTL